MPKQHDLHKLCQLCAHMTTLAPECKTVCQNSDMMVSIEACAKCCHTCVNLINSRNMEVTLCASLGKVCQWCRSICQRLQAADAGSGSQKCQLLRACCQAIAHECEGHLQALAGGGRHHDMLEAEHYAGNQDSNRKLQMLKACCQAMLTEGIQRKPQMLIEEQLDHKQLAAVEACLHMVRCIQFMCGNCPENVDCNMVRCCRRLCAECVHCGFCPQQASRCIEVCGMLCRDDPQAASPTAHNKVQMALRKFFQQMFGSVQQR